MTHDEALDAAEAVIDHELERFDPPTSHHFVAPFYIRQITMPAGFLCTTKIHGREHAFCVSKGIVIVKRSEDGIPHRIVAPYYGITEPGTRRILFCETEVVWTTFHLTQAMDIERLVPAIEQEIMIPYNHPVPIADALNRQHGIPEPPVIDALNFT